MGVWGKYWRGKSSRGIGRSQIDQRLGLKPGLLQLCQCSHWVPGRKYNGVLLHHFQDIRGEELLVYYHLVHILGEPIVRHDEVTYGDREDNQSSLDRFFGVFLAK